MQNLPVITTLPLKWLFIVALLPGLVSAVLAGVGAKEILHRADAHARQPSILQSFPRPFWRLLVANALFSLGNSSDSFLILRSTEIGLPFGHVVLAFAVYNTVYALASTPLGHLSDRIGRKPVIMMGWMIYALVYLGFAYARSPVAPWFLLGTYGLYQAFTEGVTKAMVSDVVATHQRAGAIGLFYTVSGLGQLAGSLLAGALWGYPLFRGFAPFMLGAAFALAAVPVIASVHLRKREGFEVAALQK